MKEDITIRTYRPDDLPAMVAMVNAADAVDGFNRATTVEELGHEMAHPGYYPETDCFLAWSGSQLVALADLYAGQGDGQFDAHLYCWGVVHPAWRRRGLGLQLLETVYSRAQERLPGIPGQHVYFQTWAREEEVGATALFEAFGMARVRATVNMTRPINNGLPAFNLPPGYRLRTFDPRRDLEAAWRVDDVAFRDHWGHSTLSLEAFSHRLDRPDFRPDLWLLAEEASSGEVVGVALNRIDPDWSEQVGRQEGMVATLAVLREHRHRGLGMALLAQSLRALRQAGMDYAHLGADSENLTGAVRLYERAGFRVRFKGLVYRKALRS